MPDLSSSLTRRRLLGSAGAMGLVLAGGLALGGSLANRPASTGALLRSTARLPRPFTVPLPVPAVAVPADTSGGVDRYELTQRETLAEILPGMQTHLWTYDGTFPGPTIESRRGRPVSVRHRNELPVPTVVHLHGGRTPADSDGYPTDLVFPAGWDNGGHGSHSGHGSGGPHGSTMHDPRAVTSAVERRYDFPLDQRGTLLWYHDHRMDFTAPAIWCGLAGLHVVRDDVEEALPLPRGERELPLMIADRAFDEDGQLLYPALDPTLSGRPGVQPAYAAGVLGDVILVNGAPWPVDEVSAVRHRLRILNASNARHYDLEAVTDGGQRLDLVQIGSDQGLLERPVALESLPIAPAERYDVVIDLSSVTPGTRLHLRNRLGADGTTDVMAFDVVRRAADDSHIPDVLDPDVPNWHPSTATAVREFMFSAGPTPHGRGWVIGGRAFHPSRSDVTTRLGAVEIWRFIADVHHPVHIHLVGFRVLSRGGHPPLPHDAGLKDTVSLRPGESVEVITRFDGYRGRYLFHCHNAEHEDMGMMANLEII